MPRPSRRHPRALLCDIGGVLVVEPWGLAARLLAPHSPQLQLHLSETFRAHSRELDLGRLDLAGLYNATPELAERGVRRSEFRRIALDRSLRPVSANVEFLRALGEERGLRLVAVTNVGPEVASALERKLPLAELFDEVVRSHEIGCLKPDPRFFTAAVRQARCPRADCLYVDDNAAYVRAARALALPSVRVAPPGRFRPILSARLGR